MAEVRETAETRGTDKVLRTEEARETGEDSRTAATTASSEIDGSGPPTAVDRRLPVGHLHLVPGSASTPSRPLFWLGC